MVRLILKNIIVFLSRKNTKIDFFYKNSSFLRTPFGLTVINFLFQRLFRVNAGCSIPVNFTSLIVSPDNISFNKDKSTCLSFAVSGQAYVQAINGITIGKSFLFAPGVKIISANHDFSHKGSSTKSPPITIGDDVWIGANAIILSGVELGDGCIVGAGAVVTKSFTLKNSIIAGNPAKLIKRY